MYLTIPVKGGKTQILRHDDHDQPATAVTSIADQQLATAIAAALEGIARDPNSAFWRDRLQQQLSTLPAAVSAALRTELERYAPGTDRTWTFFGHWDGDEIVVEYAEPGVVPDHRPSDDDTWPEGLWAASGTGRTQAEAQAAAVAEYEDAEPA